jgi:hypothetical protein
MPELFDKLAASTADMDQTVLQAYWELFEDLPDSEQHREMMRDVGFHWWPESADEFCRRYFAERTGG